MHGTLLPKQFFVTSGSGEDNNSELNAFDRALLKAKVTQCNIVSVSSILPPDAEEIQPVYITPGTITFAVLARMDGLSGDRISAGIGWGRIENKSGGTYGIVAEDHGHSSKRYTDKILKEKLEQMAKIRRMKLTEWKVRSESIEVKQHFGSVISTLVYVPWDQATGEREI
jgi:arginine decarboxylase